MKKGYLIYFIGRSGSGKSTIAYALEKRLVEQGKDRLQVIDGDEIRKEIGDIFGYTYEERMKNNQVVRVVVKYLLENNINVILSQVGAYQEMRNRMREQFGEQYIEVYVKCSLEVCAERDVKGYYKNAVKNLNGFSDSFEEPLNSEIVINTELETVNEAIEKIEAFMEKNNYAL